MSKILIVEDEESIAELEKDYLELSGFEVEIENNGSSGLERALNEEFDLFILDLMLPGTDGFEICKKIREVKNTPIIMVSAKKEDIDKIRGLGLGADDYIVKPLEMREVVARVRAVFRRFAGDETGKLTFDKLVIDKQAYDLVIDGKRVDAPPKEIELLYFLAQSPNRVFTRAQLLDDVWGFDYYGDTRTVDVHVKRLREKLEGVSDKWELKTVWGVGYKFETKG